MSFDVGAQAYGRFMGRYSEPLARRFVDLVEPAAGQRALDVGCGPGALTEQLVAVLGSSAVAAVDPSASFVAALHARLPEVDAHTGRAEALPFGDDTFDLALAQLVIHFMSDPLAGLKEMARVTRPGGLIAGCVWDYAGERGPLSLFWRAARDVDAHAPDESQLAGVREGHLVQLFEQAGLSAVTAATLTVRITMATFADWWEPCTLGVGPAGAYVSTLDRLQRDALEARCAQLLPPAPFDVEASAWAAVGRVGRG